MLCARNSPMQTIHSTEKRADKCNLDFGKGLYPIVLLAHTDRRTLECHGCEEVQRCPPHKLDLRPQRIAQRRIQNVGLSQSLNLTRLGAGPVGRAEIVSQEGWAHERNRSISCVGLHRQGLPALPY